jgi:hypothetical protein
VYPSGNDYADYATAACPSTPPHVLAQMALDKNKYVRQAVAGNRFAPLEILIQLANDPDEDVREHADCTIASLSSTSPDVLAQMALDPRHNVRQEVASNESTPGQTLALLVMDESQYIRQAVAVNWSTVLWQECPVRKGGGELPAGVSQISTLVIHPYAKL